MSSTRISHDSVAGLRVGRWPLGPTTRSICYRAGHTLIDTGPPNQWSHVRSFVEEEHKAHGIERVVCTHHHEDHAGNAARIQELLDVPVYAPKSSLERLQEGFAMEWYRRVVWGTPPEIEAEPLPEALPLGPGATLQAHAAPGHADDMVCLHVPERRWLFTADLFLAPRIEYLRFDEDVHALAESLHAMAQLPADVLFCGHQGVVETGAAALQEKARYLEALCGQVQRRYYREQQPLPAIQDDLLGREGMLRWLTGGDFSKKNLIAACIRRTDASDDLPDMISAPTPMR